MNNNIPIIQAVNLKKYFKVKNGDLHAVDGINLSINKGETMGVVGESGCGKSTLGRVILRLIEPTSGQMLYNGANLYDKKSKEMKEMRKELSIIFQDPYASLNPRMTVEELIADPMIVNKTYSDKQSMYKRVNELMDLVGLAKRVSMAYPHELDGGRRQRIGIAKALALNPKFIVCDEPVSALDVSIQAQILNLLMDLRDELGLTYMFITHDLSVVRHISDNISVMYMGKCVEQAPAEELFNNPLHPYTMALFKALPVPSIKSIGKDIDAIKGEVSNPINPKPGCRFAARCPNCMPECTVSDIDMKQKSQGHFVWCTLHK